MNASTDDEAVDSVPESASAWDNATEAGDSESGESVWQDESQPSEEAIEPSHDQVAQESDPWSSSQSDQSWQENDPDESAADDSTVADGADVTSAWTPVDELDSDGDQPWDSTGQFPDQSESNEPQ